jgi:SAM-dependent methyltransferase
MEVQEAYYMMKSLARVGPQPALYPAVHEMIKTLWQNDFDTAKVYKEFVQPSKKYHTAHEEFGPMNLLAAMYEQELGYAGDWKLINKIYTAYDSYAIEWMKAAKLGRGFYASLWDSYILSLRTTWSLYCREKYLRYHISNLIRQGKVKTILDIGCGNGRLLKQIQFIHPEVYCHGIDIEPTAIQAALKESRGCKFTEMNAIQNLPNEKFDLVLSAGVCDYLDDRHFQRLLKRIEYYNDPQYVIMGNLQEHENQAEMELMRWKLIYRTSTELLTMGINLFRKSRFRVGKEEMGVNLFLHIEPKE